jgi:hypothetical protein
VIETRFIVVARLEFRVEIPCQDSLRSGLRYGGLRVTEIGRPSVKSFAVLGVLPHSLLVIQ